MNWNDWEFVWKRQPLPIGESADVAQLRETFETKRKRFSRALLVRDLSESSAGVLVCLVLGWTWWKVGREAWPIGIAILLTLGVSAFFVRERLRARRAALGPDATLLMKLDDEISQLGRQHRLLSNIASWYLAPLGASWLIVMVTIGLHAHRHAPPGLLHELLTTPSTASFILGYVFVVAPLCFWFAWHINRRAVLKGIEPRLAELRKLRRDLTDPDTQNPSP